MDIYVTPRTMTRIAIYKRQLEKLNRLYMQELKAGSGKHSRIFEIEKRRRIKASFTLESIAIWNDFKEAS